MAIFTRASTAYNADGTVVAANVPRFENMTGANNLVINGDFSNGFTNWYGINNYTVANNICIFIPTGQYQGPAQLLTNITRYRGHKLYFVCNWKATATNVLLTLNDGTQQVIVTHNGDGLFHTKSGIMTIANTANNIYIRIQDGRASGWTQTQCKDFVVVDLTSLYGAGNEPTLAWCDANLSNWYGNFGLKIEEATNNLFADVTSSASSLGAFHANHATGTVLSIDTDNYLEGPSCIKAVTDSSYTSGGWYVAYTATVGKTYTFSVWLKGSGTIVLIFSGAITGVTSAVITLTDTWKRYSIPSVATSSANINMLVVGSGSNPATFYADCLQLEEKAYPTAWQLGGTPRVGEGLSLPLSVINASEFTVWFDVTINSSTFLVSHKMLFFFGNLLSNGSFYLYHYNDGSSQGVFVLAFYDIYYGVARSIQVTNSILSTGKHRIGANVKINDSMHICVDGVSRGTASLAGLGGILINKAVVGTWPTGNFNQSNAIFSNFKINSKAATPAELAYTGDLAVDEYTTYFLPLHDNLGAQTAPRIITASADVLTAQSRKGAGNRAIATRDNVATLIERKAAYHPRVIVSAEGSTRQSRIGSGNRTAPVIAPTHVDIIEPSVELSLDVIERKSETEVIGVPYIGDTITLQVKFYTFGGTLADPANILLKFFDTLGNQIGPSVSIGSQYRISAGIYLYEYTVPSGYRVIFYEFSALQGNTPQLRPGKIFCKQRVDLLRR